MVLTLALTYQLLKRFPVSMVAIYALPILLSPVSSVALNVEGEEVLDNIEITTSVSSEIPSKSKEDLIEVKKVFVLCLEEALPECCYQVSTYYKLFILYERFSIDREMPVAALRI